MDMQEGKEGRSIQEGREGGRKGRKETNGKVKKKGRKVEAGKRWRREEVAAGKGNHGTKGKWRNGVVCHPPWLSSYLGSLVCLPSTREDRLPGIWVSQL